MRLPILICAVLLLGACGDEPASSAAPIAAPQAATAWHTVFAEAAAESRASGKPILADFQGSDWCPSCTVLHRKVLDTPEFLAWAARKVVLLDVDLPNDKPQPKEVRAVNEQLVSRHQVAEYPALLLLDADGGKIAQLPIDFERLDPASWIAGADAAMPK